MSPFHAHRLEQQVPRQGLGQQRNKGEALDTDSVCWYRGKVKVAGIDYERMQDLYAVAGQQCKGMRHAGEMQNNSFRDDNTLMTAREVYCEYSYVTTTFITGLVDNFIGPTSSTSTFLLVSAESLFARMHPAVPPQAMI